MKTSLEQTYDIKAEFLGPKSEGSKSEVRILNRVVRWTEQGLEYELDQRHVDLIMEQAGMLNCQAVFISCGPETEYDETK